MNMKNKPAQGPEEEQQICVTCGFCCDGTLFWHATVQPGEKGTLPEKIEQNYQKGKEGEWFTLPCFYFHGKCTIYEQKRAGVCSSYRCQLLKDLAEKKITLHDALEFVKKAGTMREELIEEYLRISGKEKRPYFKELLTELGNVQKSLKGNDELNVAYDLLIAHCNIFEALLIKHIRSTTDFNDMMTPSKPNKNK